MIAAVFAPDVKGPSLRRVVVRTWEEGDWWPLNRSSDGYWWLDFGGDTASTRCRWALRRESELRGRA